MEKENENDLRIEGAGSVILIEQPKFGNFLNFGEVAGEIVQIRRPLNRQACSQVGPMGVLAVALHDKISSMERRLQTLRPLEDEGENQEEPSAGWESMDEWKQKKIEELFDTIKNTPTPLPGFLCDLKKLVEEIENGDDIPF